MSDAGLIGQGICDLASVSRIHVLHSHIVVDDFNRIPTSRQTEVEGNRRILGDRLQIWNGTVEGSSWIERPSGFQDTAETPTRYTVEAQTNGKARYSVAGAR